MALLQPDYKGAAVPNAGLCRKIAVFRPDGFDRKYMRI